MAALTNKVDTLIARVDRLEHSTSRVRMLALVKNGSCTMLESPLDPVPHKETGAMPPNAFPRTLGGKYRNFNVVFLLDPW